MNNVVELKNVCAKARIPFYRGYYMVARGIVEYTPDRWNTDRTRLKARAAEVGGVVVWTNGADIIAMVTRRPRKRRALQFEEGEIISECAVGKPSARRCHGGRREFPAQMLPKMETKKTKRK